VVRKLQIDGEHIFGNIVINLLPQCARCGSPVTDSIESEIEQHGKIKTGTLYYGTSVVNGYAMIV
jgi:hypothetical protein